MNKTVVELFAGVGGFRVGLNKIREFNEDGLAIENNDWHFVWANQWEPSMRTQSAFNCYCTRFGFDNHSNEDIQQVNKHLIPKHALLVGGFPCQDYSVARSLSGEKGIHGKKGVLFWEIADILEAKGPPFVLLENVDRLLKSPAKQRGRDFGIMLRTFDDKGYNVEWRVINAADYGGKQRRKRVFIFAWRKDTGYNNTLQQSSQNKVILDKGLFAQMFKIKRLEIISNNTKVITNKEYKDTVEMTNIFSMRFENSGCMMDGKVTTLKVEPHPIEAIPLRNVLEYNVDKKYYISKIQDEKFKYLKGGKKIPRKKPDGTPYTYSEGTMTYPESLDLPSRTMLTSESSLNRSTHVVKDLETGKKRFLTPVEAERLQGFPDNWTNTGMSEKQRYFMMGNALVTDVIKRIEPLLRKIIENETIILD